MRLIAGLLLVAAACSEPKPPPDPITFGTMGSIASRAGATASAATQIEDMNARDRVAAEGADVLRAIAESRTVTSEQRDRYGGLGDMTPDSLDTTERCAKVHP